MCKRWYANGIPHLVSGTETIRNVMSFSSFQSTCVHGATLVTLEDTTTKAMSQLQVGDKIQTVDAKGKLVFSPVTSLPHKPGNNEMAKFLKLTTETGKSVYLTPGHLLPLCDGKTVAASKLVLENCLLTVDSEGKKTDTLIEITPSIKFGIYAATTKDKFIVTSGIITSSLAMSMADVTTSSTGSPVYLFLGGEALTEAPVMADDAERTAIAPLPPLLRLERTKRGLPHPALPGDMRPPPKNRKP
jgi:hypothetical protein